MFLSLKMFKIVLITVMLLHSTTYIYFQTLSNLIEPSQKIRYGLWETHTDGLSLLLNFLKSCRLWTACNLSHPVVTDILLGLGLHRQRPLATISLAAHTPPRKVDLIVKAFESSAFSLGLWRRWCDGRRIS